MESVNCIICNRKTEFELLFKARDILYNVPGEFQIVRCKECGLMMINPRLDKNEMKKYYPANYGPYKNYFANRLYTSNSKIKLILKKIKLLRIIQSTKNKFFDTSGNRIPSYKKKGIVLEIGCATGSFLNEMKKKGWEVEGIEMDEKSVKYAKKNGLNVHLGDIVDYDFGPNKYDLILMFMVLEHLYNPLEVLKKCRNIITKDGYLVLSIPNSGSWEFKFFKGLWHALQPPNHLYFYNKKSIRKLLEISGFKIVKIFYQSNISSLIASTGYLLRDKFKKETKIIKYLINYPEEHHKIIQYIFQAVGILLSFLKISDRLTIWTISE